MALTDDKFKRRLAYRLMEAALRRARPKIPSRTLRRALRGSVRRLPGARGHVQARLHIPHYWAVYVHDGRRPFSKRRWMVWWKDPRRDPRLRGTGGVTPARAARLRRLTKAQWDQARETVRRWVEAGGHPYDAPVVITKAIRKGTPPSPFFSNEPGGGMSGFANDAGRIAQSEFSEHVRRELAKEGLFRVKEEATITLR